MTKLTLVPTESGYAVSDGESVKSTKLDGGLSRCRIDKVDAAALVNVTWGPLSKIEFEYIRAFFRTVAKEGANEFTIDLLINDTDLTEVTAKFIPGSMKTEGPRGTSYTITAQLEVRPDAENEDYNNALVASFNSFGEGAVLFYDALEIFVNTTMPSIDVMTP